MQTTLSIASRNASFEPLDDPQEWSAFSRPAREVAACWDSSLLIEGMHCAACSMTIEDALMAVPGVVSAEVSAGSHRARIVWNPAHVMPSGLLSAIRAAGYGAVPANDVFARERRLAQTRKALWRWLVAGLCMMQVMMYAYPAYIAAPGDLTAEMEHLLRWASWVLTLPVILFSCGPFFSSALKDVLHRRMSMDLPVALGMLITFVVSTAGTFDPTGIFGREVYFDSLTMFVFFLLTGRWLELRLRDQTAGALEALMNRLPDTVERQARPGGDFERVAVRRLVTGDVIRVLPGEAFPVDGVVLHGTALADEALLTGESRPVTRGVGAEVVAGSHNLSSAVTLRVLRIGDKTRFAEIVALMEDASTAKPQLAQLADRLAKPFLVGVLLAAGAACAYWWTRDPEHALRVAVSVLIVTCPCALSLATPAAMLASAGALARSGVLVRRLQAMEVLSKVDVVVFDKTGTLTGDALTLVGLHVRDGNDASQTLAMAAALAGQSLHPLSRAVVQAAGRQQADAWQCADMVETPGQGVSGRVGRPGEGTAIDLWLGAATFCRVRGQVQDESAVGRQLYMSDSAGWLATFEMQEDVRTDALATVAALQASGVAVHVLSGDSARAVARVALPLGIERAQGGCTPQDKLEFMRTLQRQGHKVAMVGDGLNDGPVIAGANVSFAFGNAVPIAQAKADFVVLGDRLDSIVKTLSRAKKTMSVVHQNLVWTITYNAACVPLAVLGLLPAWLAGLGMALSSLLVVMNALRLSLVTPNLRTP